MEWWRSHPSSQVELIPKKLAESVLGLDKVGVTEDVWYRDKVSINYWSERKGFPEGKKKNNEKPQNSFLIQISTFSCQSAQFK